MQYQCTVINPTFVFDILLQSTTMETNNHNDQDSCCIPSEESHSHSHDHHHEKSTNEWLPAILSAILLMVGITIDQFVQLPFFDGWIRLLYYLISYIPVGWPVVKRGIQLIAKGEIFTEFFLMGIATVGAFAIGEYPEGVAVMLFYTIGELLQGAAVKKAKSNIKSLLDLRPDSAIVKRNEKFQKVHPTEVNPGEIIQIKPGEKVPLDGKLITEKSSFNTSALTGESQPQTISSGEMILAGMINRDRLIEVTVTKPFHESSISRILNLVQNASARKAKTENFIRKFARIYTPIVTFLAIGLALLPYFFVQNYVFEDWFYRALVFLVISCPCALVISIPLGYFGGIGAASRNGILFKGSNYLDLMNQLQTIVLDKTGTLTKGIFEVQEVESMQDSKSNWMALAASLESKSNHPVAEAIVKYVKDQKLDIPEPGKQQEIAGHGLKGIVGGHEVLVGNQKLLEKYSIPTGKNHKNETLTCIFVAVDGNYKGYFLISDQLKDDAHETIQHLKDNGIKEIVILSGDKESVTKEIASELQIQKAFGNLLPEQKVEKFKEIKEESSNVIAFVGDGINDAPVLATADIGIAMGGLGSDAAIETADVVIQTDQPSKVVTAIKISKATRKIVWQNIGLAFGVKLLVLALGALGMATMWGAVFADVGVALLAVLNAVRIQKMF